MNTGEEKKKEPARGVFWVVPDADTEYGSEQTLLAFPFYEEAAEGVAKSGNTFNHKLLWPSVCPGEYRKYAYNYFPRGRVDFNGKGRPVIYMNPNVDRELLPAICEAFGLPEAPLVKYDNSEHYKCYLDDGWCPDKSKR